MFSVIEMKNPKQVVGNVLNVMVDEPASRENMEALCDMFEGMLGCDEMKLFVDGKIDAGSFVKIKRMVREAFEAERVDDKGNIVFRLRVDKAGKKKWKQKRPEWS